MRTSKPIPENQLSDREKLAKIIRGRNTPQKAVKRATIVVQAIEGIARNKIAQDLRVSRSTVYLWICRYQEEGIESLKEDKTRPGRLSQITEEREKGIVDATLHNTPVNATHWSVREMAKVQQVSRMTVQRIWKKYNLKPHMVRTFKLSNDPHFVEKVEDVVGLYLNPPDKALVLSVDEKSQIQALDRTQPGLPMKKGRCGTMTHDYKRHGTTTLFAALNMLDGKVIGQCMPKHRHQEFLKFLRKIDRETPKGLDLHLIVDNYQTHKTANVKKWLAKHPRFHLHFVPTSCSWLNMVERFFSEITSKTIRRGIFTSVPALETTIMNYLEKHNENPKVFKWTKDAGTIITKVNKCTEALGTVH